jgi:hypothetical protein
VRTPHAGVLALDPGCRCAECEWEVPLAVVKVGNSAWPLRKVTPSRAMAALVGLVKRKLRKPHARWQWRLPKRPGRDNDRQEGRAGLACCRPTSRCRGSLLRMVSWLSRRYRDPHYFHNSVKMLSRLIRREKLGIDPTLQAIALHLDPVPLPVCNLETRAFAGGPKNSPVSR